MEALQNTFEQNMQDDEVKKQAIVILEDGLNELICLDFMGKLTALFNYEEYEVEEDLQETNFVGRLGHELANVQTMIENEMLILSSKLLASKINKNGKPTKIRR